MTSTSVIQIPATPPTIFQIKHHQTSTVVMVQGTLYLGQIVTTTTSMIVINTYPLTIKQEIILYIYLY